MKQRSAHRCLHLAVVTLLGLSLLLGAAGRVGAQSATPSAGGTVDGRFDIGGRSLYLHCEGSGSPTVVLEGLPFGTSDWTQVANGVAGFTRVCMYDPAGVGLSDPPPAGARTFSGSGDDLWALLAAAGVPGPYVLVGAVLGADAIEYYQRSHPGDVAGLVMVSPRGLDPNGYAGVGELIPESDRDAYDAEMTGSTPWQVDILKSANEYAALPQAPVVPAIIVEGDQVEDGMTDAYEAVYRAARESTAARLQARLVIVAATKGNWVWSNHAEVVVQAVRDVVNAVRDPASWTATPVSTPAA